jgi:hypothetical protein
LLFDLLDLLPAILVVDPRHRILPAEPGPLHTAVPTVTNGFATLAFPEHSLVARGVPSQLPNSHPEQSLQGLHDWLRSNFCPSAQQCEDIGPPYDFTTMYASGELGSKRYNA